MVRGLDCNSAQERFDTRFPFLSSLFNCFYRIIHLFSISSMKEDGLRIVLDYYPIPYADRLLFFIIPFANTFGLMER